jgi:hypothetical protein
MKFNFKTLWVIPILIIGYFVYVGVKDTFIKTKQYLVNSALQEQGYKLQVEERAIVTSLDSINTVIQDKEVQLEDIDYQTHKLPSNNAVKPIKHEAIKTNRLGIKPIIRNVTQPDSLITRWSTRKAINE